MGLLYKVSTPPDSADPLVLVRWMLQEYEQISTILQQMQTQQVDEHFAAPKKPRNGMLVLADGTHWNPGSGRGVYLYDQTTAAWRFLG